jgi:hypothetical protein
MSQPSPSTFIFWPAGHISHDTEPVAVVKDPGLHCVQEIEPEFEEDDPGEHGLH